MKTARIILATILTVGFVGPAAAHSPFPGIGEFYNGMLHPFLVPAHLLAIFGLGLLFGQYAPRSSELAVPVFVLALAAALVIPPGLVEPLPQAMLLGLVLISGLLVAFSIDVGALVPCLPAGAAGALIGLDAAQGAAVDGQSWLSLAGIAVGAALALTVVAGLAAWIRGAWQGIAVRVLGSWTAASAFLVFSLSLLSTRADG